MAYSNLSQLHMLAEDPEGSIAWGTKALTLAEALQETDIVIHALTNIGSSELFEAADGGRARLEMALQIALERQMDDHVARCYAILVSHAIQRRDYALGTRYLRDGLAYITDRDMDSV